MRRIVPVLLLIPTAVTGILWWNAEQGKRDAWNRVGQLEKQIAANGAITPAPAQEETSDTPPPVSETKVVRVPTGTDPAPYVRTIDELRAQLQEQLRELSTAREAAAKAEALAAAETEEVKKLDAALNEAREDAQTARRVSDAVQAELRVKSDRLVRAETAEKLMQERVTRAEASTAKVAGASREIEDLNRRRDALLSTLLRRYREVNDLYRNFTLNAPTRDTAGPGLQAGDLSRIQNTIQQAEDDLRQLQALNDRMAQMARVK